VVQTKAPIAGAQAGGMQQLKIFRPSVANITAPKLDTPSARLDSAIPPATSTLEAPAAEPTLRPLDSATRSPLDGTSPGGMTTPDLGRGMPDLGGGAAQSLPSPGGVFGGAHGVLGR
jgi:hypothetical protein